MPETVNDKQVFSLLEVTRSIQKTMAERYKSSFWVKAEMNKLNFYKQSGHCYPDLVEKKEGKVIAQIRSCLWKEDYTRANNNFLQILKEPLKDGIKILFQAKILYDPAYGLSLIIMNIDPSYTLGDLEREKQETIKQLREENIFSRNKTLKLPLLPQRIAIISVETSKGYADYLRVIESNPWNYKFFHFLFPSLLQGDKAADSIINQLKNIKKVISHFDVVAIIRGGGGDVGLSCYNSYQLAKTIALFPIPVITGIGHATNETVTVMISFSNAITPTKLAEYLLQKFHNFSVPVQEAEKKVIDKSRRLLSEERAKFQSEVKLFRSVTKNILITNRTEVKSLTISLLQNAQFILKNENDYLETAKINMIRGTNSLCNFAKQEINNAAVIVRKDAHSQLSEFRILVSLLSEKLVTQSGLKFKSTLLELNNIEKNVCNMSPLNVLKRGYSITLACNISFNFDKDKNMQSYSASKEDDKIFLRKLAYDGFAKRFGKTNKVAIQRLEKELQIINDLGFNAYFLINNDIVHYAQTRGFYHVGRGSGANSIVAYCLGITDVDPIELNLYFERFLNPERTSPPDFDIDFSHRDRDEVMDYVFKRFGKDHVALCGSFSTFKHDAVIHELGKVFGLPEEEIKVLQRAERPADKIQKIILQYGKLLRGFPNILSIHPCGMLITEEKITRYATCFLPPKGFAGVQMDMFTAEEISINKFDILSQRGLGHIKECLQLIKQTTGKDIDIRNFKKFRNDDAIKKQIREANTIGCFYIESPAMRQLLKKLCCDDYLTLVAASSIIRPGVAQSGMMREYINRYHNRDKIKYLHPLFEEHLSETFGVMVFQEDVIKIGHYFAGLSLGEADVLRRAMSGKYKNNNKFFMIKELFLSNCKKLGHSDELAHEVWRQMESFAGYSFNKAHSASFAVESYMSLFLKTYYPKEFMVAVINNFGGFYSRELYFMELLKTGAVINAPCVNNSDVYTNIKEGEVYVGFIHIKCLQSKLIETIIEERSTNGAYLHLQDFIERTSTGLEQLNTLISIGAFRFTGKTKKQLLWEANFLQKNNQPQLHTGMALFEEEPLQFTLPELTDHPLDDLYDQVEIMNFTITNPFSLVDDDPQKYVPAKELSSMIGKTVKCLVYFIAHKHVITKNNDAMYFGTFIDSNLDWIDTVHFPDIAKKYPITNSGFYKVTGKVVQDFGVPSIEVSSMIKIGYKSRSYSNLTK